MTLVSARAVREHVLKLRAAGGTYEAIGLAAGTGAMTVHCIANARRPRVQATVASKLLAISETDIRTVQPWAGGTAWRLRALVAMGHTCSRMAAATGTPPATLRRIVRGDALTINPPLRMASIYRFCRNRRPTVTPRWPDGSDMPSSADCSRSQPHPPQTSRSTR